MGAAFDVVVIGAGFGGMGAALRLAEAGAHVCLLETLSYPGGCASTFSRGGYRFESGATLFSGFDPGQVFHGWIRDHGLDVTVDFIDPLVELRTPDWRLEARRDRGALRAQLTALGTPAAPLDDFLRRQRKVADALWALFDDPDLLPPFGPAELLAHARRSPRYLTLLPLLGQPLSAVLRKYGLHRDEPLRAYLNGLCQITVQCGVDEAEAPFALSTMDYYHRGTGHVRGGIGQLAEGLCEAVRRLGGRVELACRAKSLRREGDLWHVETRRGAVRAPMVVANLLPQAVRRLAGLGPGSSASLDQWASQVEEGWGAAMLYLGLEPPAGAKPAATHLELVADPARPFVEGNHVFCSISGPEDAGRAPDGLRTATVSTHVPMRALRALPESERGAYVARIQAKMKDTLQTLAPEWAAGVRHELTASPRTFARFTGRDHGYVGGVPRRAGLHNYRGFVPPPVRPGLYLVGDTLFPGQSTLATAVGGVKTADRVLRALDRAGRQVRPRTARPDAVNSVA